MAEAGGVLVSKDKPGRVLGDGELRLVEVLRVRLSKLPFLLFLILIRTARLIAAEVRDLPTRGASDRSVFCLVRLDGRDVFQSASVAKSLKSVELLALLLLPYVNHAPRFQFVFRR